MAYIRRVFGAPLCFLRKIHWSLELNFPMGSVDGCNYRILSDNRTQCSSCGRFGAPVSDSLRREIQEK